jgi:predicted ester cyclase
MNTSADIIEHNTHLARSILLDVWRDGKYEMIPNLLQPDYERIQPGRMAKGHDEFRKVLELYRGAFTGLHYDIRHIVADERFVAVTYAVRGTHTGPFLWIPPSNRSGVFMCLDFFEVQEGRLARVWTLTDDLGLMKAIGLHVVPGPLTALKALWLRVRKLFTR